MTEPPKPEPITTASKCSSLAGNPVLCGDRPMCRDSTASTSFLPQENKASVTSGRRHSCVDARSISACPPAESRQPKAARRTSGDETASGGPAEARGCLVSTEPRSPALEESGRAELRSRQRRSRFGRILVRDAPRSGLGDDLDARAERLDDRQMRRAVVVVADRLRGDVVVAKRRGHCTNSTV